ncbi:hypothetical protein TNCV_4913741 [Trichonephila clavipes]|nr:hypothetical protein TNCV_4913741 [Trichonephila clavipes]
MVGLSLAFCTQGCGFDSSPVAAVAEWYRHRIVVGFVTSSSLVPLKTHWVGQRCALKLSRAEASSRWTATAGSDVVQSGRPIFDDFFQHLWPYIGNNTANVVFQMVTRLWLIRIDQ